MFLLRNWAIGPRVTEAFEIGSRNFGYMCEPGESPPEEPLFEDSVQLVEVDSARFSLRLLLRNRATASFTVTRAGSGREPSFSPFSFARYSSSSLRLKSSAFSQLRVLALRRMKGQGPSDPSRPLMHLGPKGREDSVESKRTAWKRPLCPTPIYVCCTIFLSSSNLFIISNLWWWRRRESNYPRC